MSKKAFDDEFDNICEAFDWNDIDSSKPLLETLLEGFTLNELSIFRAEMLHKIFEQNEEIIEFIKQFIRKYGSDLDCHINDVDMEVYELNNKMSLSFSRDIYRYG